MKPRRFVAATADHVLPTALILVSISPACALSDYTLSSPGPRIYLSQRQHAVNTMYYLFLSLLIMRQAPLAPYFRVTAGCLKDGDTVAFRLPIGLVWSKAGLENTPMTDSDWAKFSSGYNNAYGRMDGNYILVPQIYSGDDNALNNVDLEVTMISEREIRVEIIGEPSPEDDAYLYIYPRHVWVEEGYSGSVNLIAEAPPHQVSPVIP